MEGVAISVRNKLWIGLGLRNMVGEFPILANRFSAGGMARSMP
jgi:hypothetical protein